MWRRCEKMWRWEDEEKMGGWEDVKKMWRCEDVKMRRCEDEKMWRCEDVKMRRYLQDVRRCEKMWRWEDEEKMGRWEDVKMRRCEDEKMWRCEDVKMRRCEDERMWRCEDVKMRRCEKMWEDVKMRRWEEDGRMRRCEVEKMWRCEDEKMWRWEDVLQTPTIGRTLRSDALGKKETPLLCLKWPCFCALIMQTTEVDLYEQSDSGELLLSSDPLLRNKGCSNFTGSGVSLADLDHDGDLDVVFGAFGAPLHVFERTPSGWRAPSAVNSSSIPLDMIELDIDSSGENYLHPSLVDWDLDGDLDLALLHDSPLSQRHRYFEHQSDGTVKEINSTTLSSSTSLVSCPIDWTVQVSFTDFDLDGKKDLIGFHSTGIVLICKQTSSGFDLVPADMNPFYSGPKRSECFLEQQRPLPLGQRVFVWPISLGRISFFRGLGFGWRHGHAQNQWPQPGGAADHVIAVYHYWVWINTY